MCESKDRQGAFIEEEKTGMYIRLLSLAKLGLTAARSGAARSSRFLDNIFNDLTILYRPEVAKLLEVGQTRNDFRFRGPSQIQSNSLVNHIFYFTNFNTILTVMVL